MTNKATGAVKVQAPVGGGWQPIETAPRDNKRALYLARIVDGVLVEIDMNASWEYWQESWELAHINGYAWVSDGGMEEPTHWAYQDGPPPAAPGAAEQPAPAPQAKGLPLYEREILWHAGDIGLCPNPGEPAKYKPTERDYLFSADEIVRFTREIERLIAERSAPQAPEVGVEPEYWQWRRKSDPWSLKKIFNTSVFATTADSEVRALYTSSQLSSLRESHEMLEWLEKQYGLHIDYHHESGKTILRGAPYSKPTSSGDTLRAAIRRAMAAKGDGNG
jgi:hypothetical protein